ncbi:MAG: hypothetical protein M3138_03120 [Actinomycetota bacterium]|nr:hypothetical protein [Actinomycetota bacterium]
MKGIKVEGDHAESPQLRALRMNQFAQDATVGGVIPFRAGPQRVAVGGTETVLPCATRIEIPASVAEALIAKGVFEPID